MIIYYKTKLIDQYSHMTKSYTTTLQLTFFWEASSAKLINSMML